MACKRLDFPEQDKLNWIVINKRNERDSLAYYWSNLLRLKAQCKYDPQLFESFDNINSRGGGVGLKKCENEKIGNSDDGSKNVQKERGVGNAVHIEDTLSLLRTIKPFAWARSNKHIKYLAVLAANAIFFFIFLSS